jgi:DNA-binding Lrp family transcriptional regulator
MNFTDTSSQGRRGPALDSFDIQNILLRFAGKRCDREDHMARPSDARKDQELISILTADARTPLSDIAKRLGVSRSTVQGRLSRLEKEGIITGYTTILATEDSHTTTISAIILIELEVKQQGNVIALLKKKAEVVHCYTLSGHFDIFVKINCVNPSHLDEIIDWIAEMDGVRRTTSSVILAKKFER